MPLSSCLLVTVPDSPLDIMEELKTTGTTKAQSWHNQSGMHHLALKKEKGIWKLEKGWQNAETEATVREEGLGQGREGPRHCHFPPWLDHSP